LAVISIVIGPLPTVKLKNGAAAEGGLCVVFRLAELDAAEVEAALEDVELDCEVVLVVEVAGVVVAPVTLVVEDFAPFGTENPTAPPIIMTTMTMIANAAVLRPGRPFLGDTILAKPYTLPRLLIASSAAVPAARNSTLWFPPSKGPPSPRVREGPRDARILHSHGAQVTSLPSVMLSLSYIVGVRIIFTRREAARPRKAGQVIVLSRNRFAPYMVLGENRWVEEHVPLRELPVVGFYRGFSPLQVESSVGPLAVVPLDTVVD